MALNEEKIKSGKFVFVSYSHKDSDAVREDMETLLERGVRVWFDVNMRLGEDWSEIAKSAIYHENCVGVIFYNSPNSFISSAVQREQEWANERLGGANFHIWSVHLNEKATANIWQEVIPLLLNPAEYFGLILPLQQKLFNTDVLCVMRSSSEFAVEEIYCKIARPYNLVDDEETFIDSVKNENRASASEEYRFGRFISNEYFGPEQAPNGDDQRFGVQKNLIQLNGKRYYSKEIEWRLMYVNDGYATLICTRILDEMDFESGREFLKNVFCEIAFADSKYADLIRARYATHEDVCKATNVQRESSLKLSTGAGLRHWWIDEDGITDYWKQTYSDDFSYQKGFSIFIKKGIRPIIEIPVNALANN